MIRHDPSRVSLSSAPAAGKAAGALPLEAGGGGSDTPSSPAEARPSSEALWETIADWAMSELQADPAYSDADQITVALLAHKRLQRIPDHGTEDRCREIAGAAFELLVERRLARAAL